jgi:hypothetical protein
MKTLLELLSMLHEADDDTTEDQAKTAKDLWDAGSPEAYVSKIQYGIKKNDNGTYQVTTENNDRRQVISQSVSASYVSSNYVKMSKDATPDVEGYVLYRSVGQQEAIQYKGDTARIDVDGKTVTMNAGDYLIKTTDDNGKTFFSVETEDAFESDWEQK